jgi:hypothetical protein
MPKKVAHNHSKKRAVQRYDVKFNRVDLMNIIKKIQDQKGEIIYRISNSRKIYKIDYLDKNYLLVYSNLNKCIVTFLPLESEERYRRHELRQSQESKKTDEIFPETWEDAIKDVMLGKGVMK